MYINSLEFIFRKFLTHKQVRRNEKNSGGLGVQQKKLANLFR